MAGHSKITTTTSTSLVGAVVVVVVVVGSALLWLQKGRRYQQHPTEIDDDDDDANENDSEISSSNFIDLPPHVKREIHKEQRRKISIRWMAMKKPMYDNIEMYGPSSLSPSSSQEYGAAAAASPPQLLCTISEKKAKWYVNKKLAKWIIDDKYNVDMTATSTAPTSTATTCPSRAIQLLFTPNKGNRNSVGSNTRSGTSGSSNDPQSALSSVSPPSPSSDTVGIPITNQNDETSIEKYTTSHKENICVVCGDNQYFMRHYIVPYCYRSLLPHKYKNHMPHDIVILCPDCHLVCEQSTQSKQKYIENKLRQQLKSSKQQQQQQQQRRRIRQKQQQRNEGCTKVGDDNGDVVLEIFDTSKPTIPNRDLYHVRSCAVALLRFKEQLPMKKIVEYETTIREYYRSSPHNNTKINSNCNTASPPASAEVAAGTALVTPIDAVSTITSIDSEAEQQDEKSPPSSPPEEAENQNGNNDESNRPEQAQEEEEEEEEAAPQLELTKEILQATTEIETTIPNPYYIPGPQLVVDSLLTIGDDQNTATTTTSNSNSSNNDDSSDNNSNKSNKTNTCRNFDNVKIEQFIKDWRMHFVETMAPRYLPHGWSVDNRVHCD